jgi:hypothetical protein
MSTKITIWTLFDAQGYIVRNGVEVQHYEDGTTRINATLHVTDDLEISETQINSKNGGWYLKQ